MVSEKALVQKLKLGSSVRVRDAGPEMVDQTSAELKFLRGLGSWTKPAARLPRRKLLIAYRRTMRTRTDWHGVDRGKILSYLDSEIRDTEW